MPEDPQDPPALKVSVFVADLLRRVLPVPPGGISIGRDPENDLCLEDAQVSRRHARLVFAHGRLWIEDLQSANGTLVDGKPVDRRAVGPGDPIEIGPFRLALEAGSQRPAPAFATVRTDVAPARDEAAELGALLGLLDSFDLEVPRDELLGRLLDSLSGAMDAERAFLYRADTRHGTVKRVFAQLKPAADAGLPVSETAVAAVARDRRACLITDLIGEGTAALASLDRLALARVRSVLITPLIRGRKLVGVLYLDSASTRRRFVARDLALLERAATCLAGLLDSVELAAELARENTDLRGRVEANGEVPLERLVAPGSPMIPVVEQVRRAAGRHVTVLILGETGTGKEVAARTLHRLSARARQRFIAINCGAVPEALVESELFGYRKGAFSGAVEDRPGLIELAHEGTLFLDEVGELPHSVQVKLLRVLEDRTVQRLGGAEATSVDFRLIAATHRDLFAAVAAGSFRQDLLYRLNVFPITLPPLRERLVDLPLLVEHLVGTLAARLGSPVAAAAPDLVPALARHTWPGNVRELRNVIERALVLEESSELTAASLPAFAASATPAPASAPGKPAVTVTTPGGIRPFHDEQKEFERRYFKRLLEEVGQSVAAMARASGLTRLTIYRKLGQLGIDKDDSSS